MAHCGGCQGHWSVCVDSTYVHKQHKKEKQPQGYSDYWTQSPWEEDQEPWRPNRTRQSPRRRTQSPRQRSGSARFRTKQNHPADHAPDLMKGKGSGKGKQAEKGGAAAFGHLPPSTQWLCPPAPPFQDNATTTSSSTSTVMQPFGKPRTDKEDAELTALRNFHSSVRGLTADQPEEVKKALAVVEAYTRKDDAKSYRQLVGLLDKARKRLADVEEQWQAFRGQWSAYLDNATKMWTSHIESYEEGEGKFAQKRKEATLHLQQVRAQLHDVHIRTMAVEGTVPKGELQEGQTALDATMMIEDLDEGAEEAKAFTQLTTDLKGVVQRVKTNIEEKMAKRTFSARSGDGEEAIILEPADKRQKESPQDSH